MSPPVAGLTELPDQQAAALEKRKQARAAFTRQGPYAYANTTPIAHFGGRKSLRKFWAIAGLLIGLLPMPSRSESTSGAMSAFGIVGSWSPDCAGSLRLTYSTPLLGTPTITIERDGKQQLVVEVQEAVRVSEEKLKFIVRVVNITSDLTPKQLKISPQPGAAPRG